MPNSRSIDSDQCRRSFSPDPFVLLGPLVQTSGSSNLSCALMPAAPQSHPRILAFSPHCESHLDCPSLFLFTSSIYLNTTSQKSKFLTMTSIRYHRNGSFVDIKRSRLFPLRTSPCQSSLSFVLPQVRSPANSTSPCFKASVGILPDGFVHDLG